MARRRVHFFCAPVQKLLCKVPSEIAVGTRNEGRGSAQIHGFSDSVRPGLSGLGELYGAVGEPRHTLPPHNVTHLPQDGSVSGTIGIVDPLADVLLLSGVRGVLGRRIEAGRGWALALDGQPGPTMHVVTAGSAWLTIEGRAPQELAAGDVVLLSPGVQHGLGDLLSTPAIDRSSTPAQISERGSVQLGTPPTRTRMVTIHYRYDPAIRTQVLRDLPDFLHVGADIGAACFDDAVRLLGRELSSPQIATTAVLSSLVDIMLIQVLRAWLATRPDEIRGTWLGMLSDPVVQEALELIHRDPANPWTTATLASTIAVSRATLSRRFPAAVGQGPAAYLTQWRLDIAAVRLRDTSDSVEAIATKVGYKSLPAFIRAFTRLRGQAPGRYRIEVRKVVLNE